MTAGTLLVGASGLAREILAAGFEGAVGILDDDASRQGTIVGGVPVVGPIDAAAEAAEQLLICVGPSRGRQNIAARLRDLGIGDDRFTTFVAPSARIGSTSKVGVGSIILDGVVVTADATIGRHVVIMPRCTITHDGVLEDFVTLAAGVSLGGSVVLGEAAYVGMNASIRQAVTVGAGATVGMGAAVITDVPDSTTWAGVPARQRGVSA